MAIFAKGADPEALEASATRFVTYAQTCDEVRESIGTSAAVIRANWQGSDLQSLAGRVPTVQHQLTTISHTLTSLGQRLTANAQAQRTTSGTYAGGGGGAPVPVGPGAGGRGNPQAAAVLAALTGSGIYGTAKLAKTLLTLPTKYGSYLQWSERIKALSRFDTSAGVFKALGQVWKPGTDLFKSGEIFSNLTRWGELSNATNLVKEGGSLAKGLGAAGKVLGPLGAVFSGVSTVSDLADGNYGRAAYDGVMTIASVAACIPPAAAIAAPIAGAMALGEMVYDHWDDITDFTSHAADAVSDFAGDAADAIGDGATSVFHSLNPFD
ncbi:WXG100 family type VII secretion target [Lapillicoccus jejuensis]|uniref:WXG100 family type VII secretion target n=1 Tax=Lapillicoccus jejuensis TaxID=402171 RepID=UPI00114F4FB4|nr:hypothetical protein [Lapillicoccus jejuensis]